MSSQKAGPAGGDQPRGPAPFPQPPWLLFGAFLLLALSLLGIYGAVTHSALLPVVQSVIGICALMIGGLLGFVFGIPRTLTRDAPGEAEGAQGAHGEGRRAALDYRPSTNLEQVSDWLTKILIGVGLVEFARMSDALSRVGRFVADDLLAGGQARHPGASVLTQAVIVGFSTGGFLAGFLWTRIHYGGMQAQADRELLRRIGEIEPAVEMLLSGEVTPGNVPALAPPVPPAEPPRSAPASETGRTRGISRSEPVSVTRGAAPAVDQTAVAVDEAPPRGGSDALPAPVAEAVERFRNQPERWNSDPGEEFFPEFASAQRNGRRLEARIVSALTKVVVIHLSVTGTERNPLAGTVRFLLHPTFSNPVREVEAAEGKAELNISANGWFTVTAIADNGRTILKYPLNAIPGAPDWFLKS